MNMKYLRDLGGIVHGFDLEQPGDVALMDAIGGEWTDVTGSWPPAPTEAEIEAAAESAAGAAVKSMLDALAQSWQYSSYESARTYKGDVNAKFNAEGTALANYGSACYAHLDGIKAGTHPRPADAAALLAALPAAPSRPTVS